MYINFYINPLPLHIEIRGAKRPGAKRLVGAKRPGRNDQRRNVLGAKRLGEETNFGRNILEPKYPSLKRPAASSQFS